MSTGGKLVTVLDTIDTIGTISTSASQMFGLISNPRAGPDDFERVVRPDLGLTANLLKCANSVYYRASREITSARDAINRMGLRRVFEIAASASFARAMPHTFVGYDCSIEQYWAHAIATAVLSDAIGREAGFTYPDLAFTAGLLHDLGKVVVSTFIGQGHVPRPDKGLVTLDEERALVSADHAELGARLALRWNLPKEICGAARWHHEPDQAETATLRYLATVVQLADGAAHVAGFGEQVEVSAPLPDDALERLSLDAGRVLSLIEKARPDIERMSAMLGGAAPQSRAAA